jgi:hypothetical protein
MFALLFRPKHRLGLAPRRGVCLNGQHLPLGVRHAGMRTEDVHRTPRLLATDVLPAIREAEASLVSA